MCIYSLSVPNNSCKRSLRAIGTPSPGAAPLFSASSRCPGSPNHIPIVASFSDSLGCLGWPLWCLRKGVSWSCMQHHLVQSHTPTKDQEDSHGRTLGCCFLVLISLRHACIPLLPGNPSKWESKKKVIINRARKSHLLAFQCNFWSQQNDGSLERWCCIPNCGVSLVRKRTGKGEQRGQCCLTISGPLLLLTMAPTNSCLPFWTYGVNFLFTQEEGPTWFILWRGRKGGKKSMWEPQDPKLGPTFVHLGCWNSDSQFKLGPDKNSNNKRNLQAYPDANNKSLSKSDGSFSRVLVWLSWIEHWNQ